MGTVFNDLRYALRNLLRQRSFSVVAVFALALGIGANTAVFSIMNGVLLRPLPYPEASRIMNIGWSNAALEGSTNLDGSTATFLLSQDLFDSVAAISEPIDTGASLITGSTPAYVKPQQVTQQYFRVIGVSPSLGREFTAQETTLGGPGAVVLSNAIWKQAFGGDPSVLGRAVRINDGSYTVVGVMPPDFRTYPPADIWTPLALDPKDINYEGTNYKVLGRLKSGLSEAQTQERLNALTLAYRAAFPPKEDDRFHRQLGFLSASYQETLTGDVRPSLLILEGAVAFVLLIACSNVAALLLARGVSRGRELAIRTALGASNTRIARLLLCETLVLALLGGIVGLALAYWAVPLLLSLSPSDLPRANEIHVDLRAALFTMVIAVATAFLAGLFPIFRTLRHNRRTPLREVVNTAMSRSDSRSLRTLIVAQTALAVVLLIGAGLLISSFQHIRSTSPGFQPANTVVAQVSLAAQRYNDPQTVNQFAEKVLDRLRATPGVERASFGSGVPLVRGLNLGAAPAYDRQLGHSLEYRAVDTDYFSTIGIPIVTGRAFTAADSATSTPVAIINQRLAKTWWPNQDPVGQFVYSGKIQRLIVGVSGDIHDRRLEQLPEPMLLVPLPQTSAVATEYNNRFFLSAFVVRARSGLDVANLFRSALDAGDPSVPIVTVRSMKAVIGASLTEPRFYSSIVSMFAGFALLLTAIGIYGLISYEVVQRTREIGIRLALGAQKSQVLNLILGSASRLALGGILIGCAGAFILTRYLRGMLFEIQPTHLPTFLAVIAMLGGIALLSAFIPARRATRVEPMSALRGE